MTSSEDDLGKKTVYEEIGRIHRFFLGWRNATVVALVAILYFGFSLFLDKAGTYESKSIPIIILCSTAFIVLILWALEVRTRRLYRAAQWAGSNLEKKLSIRGAYRGFSYVRPKSNKICIELSHSFLINLLCVMSVSLIIVFGCFYYFGTIELNTDKPKVQSKEFSQKEKEYLKILLKEKDLVISNELKSLHSEIRSIKNMHYQKVKK